MLFGSLSGLGVTNTYDGFGRKTSATSTTGNVSRRLGYAYDLDGDRKHLTHPDSSYFIYTYDGIDRLSTVLENGSALVVSESYYPDGPRSTEARSAVSTSYAYDPVQRLSTLTDTLAGTASITSQFAYSPANQITSRTRNNNAYIYTGYTNGSTNYTANGLNEYSSVSGTTFSNDDNGNLTSDGANTYGYDIENRVTSVSGAHAATLSYDPLGRLFQVVSGSTTTQFLYDGDALVAEYNGSNQLQRRYVHGAGVDNPVLWYESSTVSSTTRRSLQADHQGSIISVANSSGTTLNTNTYDDYGVPGSSNAGRFQYTGQIMIPEVGLYYYKARMYAPKLGRFLQTDPIGYKDDMDLYTYVGNDPMGKNDPSGNNELSPMDWYHFGVDNGRLLVDEIVFAAAKVNGDEGVANEALTGMEEHRAAAAESTAVFVTPPGASTVISVTKKTYTAGAKFSRATKILAAIRAKFTCQYCGKTTSPAQKSEKGVTPPSNEAQTDHYTPASKNGDNSPDNAVHSCRECNQRLSDSDKTVPNPNIPPPPPPRPQN